MNVGQICSRKLLSIPASAPISDAAKLMHEGNVGAIVVTRSPASDPLPIGIITDRDIMRAQLSHTADLTRLWAEDVMTPDPLVVHEDTSLEDAVREMRDRGVRRAPVISATGALIGIVSTDDLISTFAREITGLAQVLEKRSAPHS